MTGAVVCKLNNSVENQNVFAGYSKDAGNICSNKLGNLDWIVLKRE